ncbi:hypothetical protein LP421_13455 [Rhizobium sp. RCAM05350]|nr:hypothetical protein LP421_13455 [Rhizobium sp. RCAM05350]
MAKAIAAYDGCDNDREIFFMKAMLKILCALFLLSAVPALACRAMAGTA